MDRVTRHLVFQLPQTSHKHDYNDAPQAGAWAEQRADSDDDVFGPAQHSSQRVENGYGWKTRSKSPSYFLDGGRDVWTPSPDRESKLEVVRSGSLYDLRAYRGERKPSKLYDEDEQEQCRVPPPNISPEKAKELEDERKEVIRNQVMRKSSTMAERWSSTDELSSINTSTATPVDPENIDTEQINFSAARQQFLMLEKTNPGSFFSPGLQAMSPKPESMTKVSRQEWPSPEKAAKVYAPRRADTERPYPTRKMSSLTKASSREDLDSGLGEMYNEASVGYASDGSASSEIFNGLVGLRAGSNGLDKETKISNETPIEREIRMAMEREENLWKERGIQRLTSSSELVEIKTKPLLSMDASPSPGRKGKDKGHASRYVQREIEQETKREEDLKKQGRLLGMYDRGTQQELDERRRVFEQEEAPPQKPTPPRKADERRSWVNEFVAEQPMTHGPWPAEDTRGGRSLPSCATSTTRFQAAQPPCAASEKSQDQPLVSRHVSASASKWGSEDSWGGRLPSSTPSPAGTAVLPRRYFSFSFWKPKVSFVEDMGTQNPLRREDGREEQYRLRTWKPQTSALIDKEIQSDLQREEELQEQRRRRQLIDGYSLVSGDGVPQDGSRSRHSSGKGTGGAYAGIEPIDKINTEVVESTRVTRHKSTMAQRWEAGQYVRDDD
uniref:A-kinase anchor protein 2 C-terminal domain-containing protein n=1 Tax=Strix occidentalis caurina TaxID=311401 RepID=A0A8D0ENI4_STROC